MFLASTSHLPKTRRTRDIWISVVSLLTLIAVFRSGIQSQEIWPNGHLRKTNESNADDCPDVDLVVASQMKDNTTWLHDSFADWRKLIYVTNDPNATFTVPSNKGREGMVYLTYIINNYDNLADIIIFLHANRYQWHNDDPLYDGLRVLSRLHLSHVLDQGYANLRCVWTLGCPSEIRPLIEAEAASPASDPASNQARAGSFYKSAFEELFPDIAVPDVVAAACCAQFAVTANKFRQRPRNDYERFRMWLLRSELNDDLAGRIMEYSWHSECRPVSKAPETC